MDLKSLAVGSSSIIESASMVNSGIEDFHIIGLFSMINSQFPNNLNYANMPWILDSGSTEHMTLNPFIFISYILVLVIER